MTQQTAAPYTVTDLTVPYGEKIAISTNGGGIVTIWYQTGIGVSPPGFYVHDRINNEEVLLGTFAAEQVVRIDTSGSPALYDIGASPSVGSGDADTLKGYSPDATDTADTVALRDSSGDIQANAFESTVATGTAPFTVASTTVVTNLNADLLDGQTGSYYATNSTVVHLAGTETVTGSKTFNEGITIDRSSNAFITLDAGSTSNISQILMAVAGSTAGKIVYNHNAAAANETLDINVGGINNTILTIYGSGTVSIANNKYFGGENTGGAVQNLLGVNGSNITQMGTSALPTNINSNGTLTYNGASLATGSIDTTAAQTITVVDGLITAIA